MKERVRLLYIIYRILNVDVLNRPFDISEIFPYGINIYQKCYQHAKTCEFFFFK